MAVDSEAFLSSYSETCNSCEAAGIMSENIERGGDKVNLGAVNQETLDQGRAV